MTLAPITFADVLAARERLKPHLAHTPLRNYPLLDELVGHDMRVWVKHENHHPTQSFKIRNGISAVTALSAEARTKGVIAASTGNHGQGVAYAGHLLGVRVTICVPQGSNPEKNASIKALGAELIETGASYDECLARCEAIMAQRGMTLLHATNNRDVIAGAGTMALEILEQEPGIDAIVVSLGGGSQAVGAIIVAAEQKPGLPVYAVGAEGAPAQFESWSTGQPVTNRPRATFAEGIDTGASYDLTIGALHAGLSGFVQVSDLEMYAAIRDLLRITHNLSEGAGAASLAGLRKLAPGLAGQRVAIVLSGGNLSTASLSRALRR